ncbi:hypothetical protein E8E12_002891 [Didymella heteroderae]|uniref:Uncharacterized protein n=1 Tax=Didymella heteroderae TaxID=1769908 RepID=A0A9P5C430_9PLEO|nr:hypothetical protein E8E12_002891 [Didymella heteroderae]
MEWDKHVCRGEKLSQASKLDKDKAEAIALPIGTPWSGNLQAERKKWGYFDSEDPDCNFEGFYYDISRALKALGIEDGDCFRTQHYDPEKEGEIKDQTYKVGTKDYRATGAHGTFGINVEKGAVFLIDVASAPRNAAQLWGVVSAPKDHLPELRQISDIAWGFWYQAHGGSDLGHITKFVVPQVINDVTGRLINQALKTYEVTDGEERDDAVPEWPGVTFETGTPPGNALLGSPVGIATAYFLSQHKPEIGKNKYVSKITVFRPDKDTGFDEPTIVYHVEDAPAPLRKVSDSDGNLGKGFRWQQAHNHRDLSLAAEDLVSATDKNDTWYKCVCRGDKLTEGCKVDKDEATQFVTPIDTQWKGTMEAELDEWGYHDQSAASYCSFHDIEDALNALKISPLSKTEGGENYCYYLRHSLKPGMNGSDDKDVPLKDQTYTVNKKTYRMTGAKAIIGANTVSGAIFFLDVKSAASAAEDLWYPRNPRSEELPQLRAISDISWASWNRAWMDRPENERGLGNINYFIIHNIVNIETGYLIEKALRVYGAEDGQPQVAALPQWPGLDFHVESEAGKALLGSANGIAAGYFLAQRKEEIGANNPWEGTMEEELKLWGYTQPKGVTLYCDFSSTEREFKEMGIDTKFRERTKDGQNECYQAHHSKGGPRGKVKEQTYEVDKKTYRMTDAIMQMGVNARDGVFTFFNVRSAEQSAMQLWGTDEVAAEELPALNRVSDISWAFWKRAHKNDAGLNNIQKFHVHDAVNKETLRPVNMALKTYRVPDGDVRRSRLPRWPGLVFDVEADEGKAMLGSPNGIAAGYFLVQHKSQLGSNKYIFQVTLWMSNDGDVQIMFWVKDAPPQQATLQGHGVRRGLAPEVKVVNRSQDSRSIIREHRVLAKF